MFAISVACHIAPFIIGVQFLRLRSGLVPLFVRLMAFEVVFVFGIILFGFSSRYGGSVAAAFGAALGGLGL